MNFDLSDEQQLLKDSVDRFVSDNYDLDTRQKLSKNEAGFSDTYWQTMAELGWLGVTIPEAHGGFGGTQADTMVLMEAFGKVNDRYHLGFTQVMPNTLDVRNSMVHGHRKCIDVP